MSIDVKKLDDDQLKTLIANHRKEGETSSTLYLNALEELEGRKGKGLNFRTSFEVIKKAAKDGRYVSYKELADESGVVWNKAYRAIGPHLFGLVEFAHRQGWPMLSSIVVNKKNLESGELELSAMKGFISAAHTLGYKITDEKQFVRDQQLRVFAWAKKV
jgi:hypothetical protein